MTLDSVSVTQKQNISVVWNYKIAAIFAWRECLGFIVIINCRTCNPYAILIHNYCNLSSRVLFQLFSFHYVHYPYNSFLLVLTCLDVLHQWGDSIMICFLIWCLLGGTQVTLFSSPHKSKTTKQTEPFPHACVLRSAAIKRNHPHFSPVTLQITWCISATKWWINKQTNRNYHTLTNKQPQNK